MSARPVAVKTACWICSVAEYVSTSGATTPSRVTRAIPVWGPRAPIQVIAVPVKVNVACAPAVVDSYAIPALHNLLVLPGVQPAV